MGLLGRTPMGGARSIRIEPGADFLFAYWLGRCAEVIDAGM